MSDHRIRLTDEDISLIVSCLNARMAMLKGGRRKRAERLVERLAEGLKGNPDWRFGWIRDEVAGDQLARQSARTK